jgi:uncharacterized membrane protein
MAPPLSSSALDPDAPPHDTTKPGALTGLARQIRTRIITGLVLALPIVLTFWILYWIYATLTGLVLAPMTWIYRTYVGHDPSAWWDDIAAPIIAVVMMLFCLYVLGLLVRSSLLGAVDWVLLRLPVVTTIYQALSNVFRSLGDQMQRRQRPQRVVLVEFPHPGTRALAFVTNSLQDSGTGKTILCVWVLTGVMPPAGFTLFVPEEAVIDVSWTASQALQAILSGGISLPQLIPFSRGAHVSEGAGPILDTHGHPIDHAEGVRAAGTD